MKIVKQKSTGKIVFREEPHGDDAKVLENASAMRGIDVSDLEVVEESYTDDQWNAALHNQLPYDEKRKIEYDKLNQFELIGEDSINGTTNHKDAILAIKAKYPKE